MQQKRDFKNDAQYQEYCIAYFAGQILAAQNNKSNPTGQDLQDQAEKAVRQASALQKALNAWVEESETFSY